MLVSLVLLILLVQFEIRGCAAVNDSNTTVEDLSQFPQGPEKCPDFIAWPKCRYPFHAMTLDAAVFPGPFLHIVVVNKAEPCMELKYLAAPAVPV